MLVVRRVVIVMMVVTVVALEATKVAASVGRMESGRARRLPAADAPLLHRRRAWHSIFTGRCNLF
jgi:hypothetical protein